jgi:predicted NBD/HSP70 family sugar kinase
MSPALSVTVKHPPPLDPGFLPAALWTRAYRARVTQTPARLPLAIALTRPDGLCFVHETLVLPQEGDAAELNRTYIERLVKFLLWQKGGSRLVVGGSEPIARMLAEIYRPGGARAFDVELIGRKAFLDNWIVESRFHDALPAPRDAEADLGRHLEGCRIGFDLGGSDRKCAALIDGRVVHAEEVAWDPYFQKDPRYHYEGIMDSIRRAASKLPRVDAIGGSAAGVYIHNEARVASLFRGVSPEDFERHVRGMFHRMRQEWDGVPFEVVNDGEVAALAGSMALGEGAVLGISMGTSQAGGYVTPGGHITSWLNELAFAPIDYRADAPADEWSGDVGCGVQYFSQQAVARLAPAAGITLPREMPPAERLIRVQQLMATGDIRARAIYETLGAYLGYAIAHYADFYEARNVLLLGRVMAGLGGETIIETAEGILKEEFPALAESIRLLTPGERDRRHGQAIAAASLPSLPRRSAS